MSTSSSNPFTEATKVKTKLPPALFCNHREVSRMQWSGWIIGGSWIISAIWIASVATANYSSTSSNWLFALGYVVMSGGVGVWLIVWASKLPLWTVVCSEEGFSIRREVLGARPLDVFHHWDAVTATSVKVVENDEYPDDPYLLVETADGPVLGKETTGLFRVELIDCFNLHTPQLPYIWQCSNPNNGKKKHLPMVWQRRARASVLAMRG